jgi:hypothetical protein
MTKKAKRRKSTRQASKAKTPARAAKRGKAKTPATVKPPRGVGPQAALTYATQGDLRAAAQALRRGAEAKGEKRHKGSLSESERKALERIARLLEKLLGRKPSAAESRAARALQRLMMSRLELKARSASIRAGRSPAPGRARPSKPSDKKTKRNTKTTKTKTSVAGALQVWEDDPGTGVEVSLDSRSKKVVKRVTPAPPAKPLAPRTPRPPPPGAEQYEARRGSRRAPAAAPIATRAPRKARTAAKPTAPVVRRTPHMEIPQTRLQPGTKFKVSIFADHSTVRPGETSTEIMVESGAILEVRLIVSAHFSIVGPAATRMTITEAERADAEQRFNVRVQPKNELPVGVVPSLIALFFHNGRPCGSVRRTVDINGVATQNADPPPGRPDSGAPPNLDPPPGRIQTDNGAPADLTIVVTSAVINDGRQFFCTVRSPSLDKYRNGLTESWNLPQAAEDIVLSYMERFTADAITPSMLLAELRGAGRQLFDAAPKVFRQAFWDLIDAGVGLRTIAIVTEEPFIPWELMIPYRMKDGRRQQREALGTEFLVGRWPSPDNVSPLPHIDLVDSFVIAPVYTPPLSFAQAEAAMVADSFQGVIIAPADFDSITQELSRVGKTLIHFICHGEDEDTQAEVIRDPDRRVRNRVQTIRLEKGQTINSTQIVGIDGLQEIFEQRHPLVFINACEIGRTTPALLGVGGFAKSFIDIGASAVIAPLWSVKDRFAHEVAKTFYERLKSAKGTPFAEIIRDLRRKAYGPGQAEDTFAAYCFYGDPAASQ